VRRIGLPESISVSRFVFSSASIFGPLYQRSGVVVKSLQIEAMSAGFPRFGSSHPDTEPIPACIFRSSGRPRDRVRATEGALAQRAETLYRPARELSDMLPGMIIRGAMQELDSLRLEPDLGEQPLHRADPNLGPIVALSQTALPRGTRDDTEPVAAGLQGMEEVLRVDLSAARDLSHENMDTVLVPLARHVSVLVDAALADIHNNVRLDRLCHRDLPDVRGEAPGQSCHE
jgi:hypothetical protein